MKRRASGFTLAELLIALAILGVIGTFTIPKIIGTDTSSKNNAIAREAMAMVSSAFAEFRLSGSTGNATLPELSEHMNFAKWHEDGIFYDNTTPAVNSVNCSSSDAICECDGNDVHCLELINGAYLMGVTTTAVDCGYNNDSTSALVFILDPDGKATGNQDSLQFFLYPSGQIRLRDSIDANTYGGGGYGPYSAVANTPSWFSWN